MADLKGEETNAAQLPPRGLAGRRHRGPVGTDLPTGPYARRSVGIARFVYNRMVANDQAGRDAGLWLSPHELEKEFNAPKGPIRP